MHFGCSGPGSVSLLTHSLEERSCRLLIGCSVLCQMSPQLPHQLRQTSPGAEVVRTAMEGWQTNMMTSFATDKERTRKAK